MTLKNFGASFCTFDGDVCAPAPDELPERRKRDRRARASSATDPPRLKEPRNDSGVREATTISYEKFDLSVASAYATWTSLGL
jgi:hypothetical protein